MSDMLQLVVKFGELTLSEAIKSLGCSERALSLANMTDKLKHVAHRAS